MKTLHLQADRSLELHTQSAAHYRVRMPRHGRALAYHYPSCDAIVAGEGPEVWRMNLEVGRFMKPFGMEGAVDDDGGEQGGQGGGEDTVTGVNAIDLNPAHQLMSFGTETASGRGTVELWDPRSRSRAGILRLPYSKLLASSGSSASLLLTNLPGVDDIAMGRRGVAVTALSSKFDGLNLAVGTSTGHILLYDLRSNKPYTTKDQGYGLPIKKVEWVESGVAQGGDAEREGGWIASADEKVVKIWGKETVSLCIHLDSFAEGDTEQEMNRLQGTNLISINPPTPINDMHIYPATGLMLLANEASPMTAYYIPQVGPAPKWARFLDNMTEEMEDGEEALMYDDYKFVDRQELDRYSPFSLRSSIASEWTDSVIGTNTVSILRISLEPIRLNLICMDTLSTCVYTRRRARLRIPSPTPSIANVSSKRNWNRSKNREFEDQRRRSEDRQRRNRSKESKSIEVWRSGRGKERIELRLEKRERSKKGRRSGRRRMRSKRLRYSRTIDSERCLRIQIIRSTRIRESLRCSIRQPNLP